MLLLDRRPRPAALFVLLVALALIHPSPTRADSPPRVFAFYYAWYDEQTWSPEHVADIPAEKYVSRDPGAIARQIDQAQGAGIDAFVVSWLGPGNPTDERFRMMLDTAGGKGFTATVDVEANRYGSREALTSALVYVRDQLEPHGAFARVNGKPIVFFWREQVRSVDDWAAIRQAVDPNHDQIWIAEGVNIAYQRVFDGHHLYSIAWAPDVNHTLSDWARRVRQAGPNQLWVATVMPGYDDTHTTRPDKFARARQDGAFYRATWEAALSTRPDLLIINSFNEWVEGTMIEPSVTFGNLYLDLTREYAAQFKGQAPLPAEDKAGPAATRTPYSTNPSAIPAEGTKGAGTATPTLSAAELAAYRATALLRVRAGPGTTFQVLGQVPRDFVLDVLARSEDNAWLAVAWPDVGSLGWVSAEYVTPKTGLEQFPVEVAPASEKDRAETDRRAPEQVPDDGRLPDWY